MKQENLLYKIFKNKTIAAFEKTSDELEYY